MPPSKGKRRASLPTSQFQSPSPSPSGRSPLFRSGTATLDAQVAAAEEQERQVRSQLSAARASFPSLVSEEAFVGRLTELEGSPFTRTTGSAARVWLPEGAFVSSSLVVGSLVSVCLASSDSDCLEAPPLEAFYDNYARFSGSNSISTVFSGLGNHFAIAKAYYSSKVSKNELRLSWPLAVCMGFPPAGRWIFVSPIISSLEQRNQDVKSKNSGGSLVSTRWCENLYLKLVGIDPRLSAHSEKTVVPVLTESRTVQSPNGHASSPRTPYQSKLSSPSANLFSPGEDKQQVGDSSCLDISLVKAAINDEKLSDTLKIFALRWLYGMHLLVGNLVSLPISGRLCIFVVETTGTFPENGPGTQLDFEASRSLSFYDQKKYDSEEPSDSIFVVNSVTKVSMYDSLSSDSGKNICSEKLPKKDVMEDEIKPRFRLGGLSKEFSILKEMICFSLFMENLFPRYKGILLHGPPGTGKTSLVSACSEDACVKLFLINGPEVISQYYGESEQALRAVFESAKQAQPAMIFIDELDAIAPTRKEGGEDLSIRMVATLLTLMDEINEYDRVLLVATTNRPNSIDPALRRPGRLDREIEIGVPSPEQRFDILTAILDGMFHSLNKEEIKNLAMETHGFVGADLAALCNEAAMITLRRYIEYRRDDKLVPLDQDHSMSLAMSQLAISDSNQMFNIGNVSHNRLHHEDTNFGAENMFKISAADFEKAKMKVRPSAMREVMLEFPKVRWEDVGGQAEVKRQLFEAVQLPQKHPDAFKRIGIQPPKGLLMFGPPGCSKTLLARAVAAEAKLNFLAVKGPELFSKWVGESEKAVKSLFAKAKANSPAIIFFDEIDGLAVTRGQDNDGTSVGDRVLSQLLIELDGLDQRTGIVVIAATNRPDKIDPALLRPGRFDRHLDVKPPDESDRQAIFRIHTKNMPYGSDVSLEVLAGLTEGYTGADIKLVCREAAIAALEENIETLKVSLEHFKVGIRRVRPSDPQFYLAIADKFKRYVDTGNQNINKSCQVK